MSNLILLKLLTELQPQAGQDLEEASYNLCVQVHDLFL
jgi:hypothetical protein